MMALSLVVGWLVVRRLGRRIAPEVAWEELYGGTFFCGIVGAKLLLVLIDLPALLAGEHSLLSLLKGGGVWIGGVIGGFAFAAWFLRRTRLRARDALAVLFTALPLAHAVGRVGCFLAGCCYGDACDLPWAVTYTDPQAAAWNGTPLGRPLHPTQLYEAALELANFPIVLWVWHRRPRSWAPVATWLGLYGTERFALELLRADPRGAWLGLSTSQWLALGMVAVSICLLIVVRRRPAAPTGRSLRAAR